MTLYRMNALTHIKNLFNLFLILNDARGQEGRHLVSPTKKNNINMIIIPFMFGNPLQFQDHFAQLFQLLNQHDICTDGRRINAVFHLDFFLPYFAFVFRPIICEKLIRCWFLPGLFIGMSLIFIVYIFYVANIRFVWYFNCDYLESGTVSLFRL